MERIKVELGDPDQKLELQDEIKKRLRHSLERVQKGEQGISAEEVAKRAGLSWRPLRSLLLLIRQLGNGFCRS